MAELAERLRARRIRTDEGTGSPPLSGTGSPPPSPSGAAGGQRPEQATPRGAAPEPELERKLRERRSVVDSKGTLFLGDAAAAAHEGPKREAEPSIDQWGRVSSSAAWPPRGSEAAAVVGSAGGRPFASGQPAAAASAVAREPAGSQSSAGSELMRKLQARRGVVDSEGSAWQKLPEAQPAVSRTPSSAWQKLPEGSAWQNSEQLSCEAESAIQPRCGPPAQPVASRAGSGELEAALQRRRCAMDEPPSPQDAKAETPIFAWSQSASCPSRGRLPARRPCQPALPPEGALGLPLPWERLRRGALTWACEFWAPRALLPQDAPSEDGACQPGVLCLSGAGEVFVCAAALAPTGAPEQEKEDYARLLVSLKAQLLLSVCRWSGAPHAVGFCVKSDTDDGPRSVFGNPADRTALVARLESEREAAAFLAALGDLLPWLSEAFLDMHRPGSELVALPLFAEASTVAPGSECEDVETSDLEEEPSQHAGSQHGPSGFGGLPSSGPDAPDAPVEKMDTQTFLDELDRKLDTQTFLEELDGLAGFA